MAQNAPRTSVVASSVVVKWSDQTLFDGFLLIGVVPPTLSATDFISVAVGEQKGYIQLPRFYMISIVQGQCDPSVGVFWTSDLDPPGVTYVDWIYDRTGRKLTANASIQFTVTADTFSPPIATLTVSTLGSTPPTPN